MQQIYRGCSHEIWSGLVLCASLPSRGSGGMPPTQENFGPKIVCDKEGKDKGCDWALGEWINWGVFSRISIIIVRQQMPWSLRGQTCRKSSVMRYGALLRPNGRQVNWRSWLFHWSLCCFVPLVQKSKSNYFAITSPSWMIPLDINVENGSFKKL